jgi:hydroxypyruvate isomerase
MTGYIGGTLADDAGPAKLLHTARQWIDVAKRIGCPRLDQHGTGLDRQGLPVVKSEGVTGAMWLKAVDMLRRIADLGEAHGLTLSWRI